MRSKRTGAWTKVGKDRGLYSRRLASGQVVWGYYSTARRNVVQAGASRQVAVDAQAKDRLRQSAGLPALDTRTRIADLAEEVREAKRGRLKPSSFRGFEFALDRYLLPELGHLRPVQVTAERLAGMIRELDQQGLAAATINRYLSPLGAIFKLAIRRGCISVNPLALLTADERPRAAEPTRWFEWEPETLSRILAAAEELDRRREARQRYYPLVATLVFTGCRVGEALALRWGAVDLLGGLIEIRYSWSRHNGISTPKTAAGNRAVPIPDRLVDILGAHKPLRAGEDDFVFAARHGVGPISYWNFRDRGWVPTLKLAGLAERGIRIHDLRHAAASLLISHGVSDVDVAAVLGHANPNVTRAIYAHVFARDAAHDRVRSAYQLTLGEVGS